MKTSNTPMLLNTLIFRNIQLIFLKIFLLFIPISIAEEAEFCMKEVLISPNILNHAPQLLSPIYLRLLLILWDSLVYHYVVLKCLPVCRREMRAQTDLKKPLGSSCCPRITLE